MKMKSKRRIERDRAARDPRRRALPGKDTGLDGELDDQLDAELDLGVARSLQGYDE